MNLKDTKPSPALTPLSLSFASFLLVLLMLSGTVKEYTAGDSRMTLLTSQMLVQTGSTHLNPALDGMDLDKAYGKVRWQIWTRPDTKVKYYTYPFGTAIFAMPFVWVANRLGLDMAIAEHDTAMQRFMSAVLAVLLLLVLHRIGRRFLPDLAAVVAALLFVVSTTIMSTFGSALWSHNLATLLVALAVNQMLNSELPGKGRFSPWVLGALLFCAYLARPTALAFIPVAIVWMVWRHGWKVWKTLLVLVVMEGLFILFCLDQFGIPFHSYYRFGTWERPVPWGSTVPELLLSPSRGLFTFTPLLLFSLLGPLFKKIRRNLFWWAMLAGFALHLLLLSRHECWYAGYAYGPRFFSEVHPQLFVMLIILAKAIHEAQKQWLTRIAWTLGTVSITFGIFVHTRQGLFNAATYAWNNPPGLLAEEDFMAWNWHYPQFLANDYRNGLKAKEFEWWMRTSLLSFKTLPDACIMVGSNDPEVVTFARRWDLENTFADRKVLSNPGQLRRAKVREVFLLAGQTAAIDTVAGWKLEPFSDPENLSVFLEEFARHHVFLAAQGAGITDLSPEMRAMLLPPSADSSALASGSSYVCHFANGRLADARWSADAGVSLQSSLPDGSSITAESGGVRGGNFSRILFDGMPVPVTAEGLNAMVFDDHGHPVAFRTFDLANGGVAFPFLMKATKVF